MGSLCACLGDSGPPEERARSKEVDKFLVKDRTEKEDEIKLLLLGAGESGKSTIFKQMKIIHQDGYSEEERKGFRAIVHSNIVTSLQALVEASETLEIDLGDQEPFAETVLGLGINQIIDPALGQKILDFWNSEPIQTIFERSAEFQLADSCKYYLDDILRILDGAYVPSEQDVLRTRVRTTGIVEMSWEMNRLVFKMFDVGGQRNERRKWIHCFDNVTAVIFVAAISEYDQVLFEDPNQNRMGEALNLFEQICNSRWFLDTSMILFLNKMDLFQEKIPRVPLSTCFPEYDGPSDYNVAAEYIAKKFQELNRLDSRQVYTQLTCATDTNNIRFVFDAVRDTIMQNNLRESGF